VQAGQHTDTVPELLLAYDKDEQTDWHLAAVGGHIEVLVTLWECSKEKLTTGELRNEFFLAKDNMEQTAWTLAAEAGNLEILQKLWEWGKETNSRGVRK
jgi:ankyrin repeat protein